MREYATLDHLQIRIDTHRLYSERPSNVDALVWDAIGPQVGNSLLDVGCGTGTFLQHVREHRPHARLVGADTSAAALAATVGPDIEAVEADIQALPFKEGEFSATTARHMLYHVPNPGAGLRECARVTVPGGPVAITVNTARQLPRIVDTLCSAYQEALGTAPIDVDAAHSTDGDRLPALMHDVFDHVVIQEDTNALVFHSPEPVARYIVTLLGIYDIHPEDPRHLVVAERIHQRVENWFSTSDEPWRDPKGVVLAVGTRS